MGDIVKFPVGSPVPENGDRGNEVVPLNSSIDPLIVAQILAIKRNQSLTDASRLVAQQSLELVSLSNLERWLRFVSSDKIMKKPSFYIAVLEKYMHLCPDLTGLYEKASAKLVELEGADGADSNVEVARRIDELRFAVKRLGLEAIGKNIPEDGK